MNLTNDEISTISQIKQNDADKGYTPDPERYLQRLCMLVMVRSLALIGTQIVWYRNPYEQAVTRLEDSGPQVGEIKLASSTEGGVTTIAAHALSTVIVE